MKRPTAGLAAIRDEGMSMNENVEVLKGTLDLMILKALSWGPRHGYGLTKFIRQTTDEVLAIEDGALYPALHRLEDRDWIAAEWGTTENNRRAKYYRLTSRGRAQLQREIRSWARFSEALWKIIEAEQPA